MFGVDGLSGVAGHHLLGWALDVKFGWHSCSCVMAVVLFLACRLLTRERTMSGSGVQRLTVRHTPNLTVFADKDPETQRYRDTDLDIAVDIDCHFETPHMAH